jgi:hypothetical protein
MTPEVAQVLIQAPWDDPLPAADDLTIEPLVEPEIEIADLVIDPVPVETVEIEPLKIEPLTASND